MVLIVSFDEANTILLLSTLTILVQAFIELVIINEDVDEQTFLKNIVNALNGQYEQV